jgi:hypothetical protein
MTNEMNRTTEDVFNYHKEAIAPLDFEKLAADYAQDAVLVTLEGSFKGPEAIMKDFFQATLGISRISHSTSKKSFWKASWPDSMLSCCIGCDVPGRYRGSLHPERSHSKAS